MKKVAVVIGIILLSLVVIVLVLFFVATSTVEPKAYFEEDYYLKTRTSLDSMDLFSATGTIEAGFAKVSITPGLNAAADDHQEGRFVAIPLAGYGGREGKPATGVHDSIFVSAAALTIAGKTIVLVTADLLIMPPNVVDSVTSLLRESGLQREQIFYSATHTHASVGAWGPGFVGKTFAGEENPAVVRWLASRIAQAIQRSIADLRPARIGTGSFTIPSYTRNRLIGVTGTKNNDFSYIVLEQIGSRKAILGSYSAHATVLSEDTWEVSGDYPGYWVRKMESTGFDVALFFAGSVGSQGPLGKGKGFDRASDIGEGLADSLNVRLPDIVLQDSILFTCVSLKMNLPDFNIRLTRERNISTTVSHRLLPLLGDTYLQVVRLGNMIWVTTPSDFSGEYALQLKNSLCVLGYDANVTSFNGSYVGYIVPPRYFYLDEYEPRIMGWFGPNMGEYTMDMIRQLLRAVTETDNI